MTPLLVACALGTVAVDLDEEEETEVIDDELPRVEPPEVDLPLLVAAAAHGSTVVAVSTGDRRSSSRATEALTWREAGAGLGAASRSRSRPSIPTSSLFATAERLHVSRDGGRFWTALAGRAALRSRRWRSRLNPRVWEDSASTTEEGGGHERTRRSPRQPDEGRGGGGHGGGGLEDLLGGLLGGGVLGRRRPAASRTSSGGLLGGGSTGGT